MTQEKEQMVEKFLEFKEKFSGDDEVNQLLQKLRQRFAILQDDFFSSKDFESDEFEEMNEEYWAETKHRDVDDLNVFDFFWFQ